MSEPLGPLGVDDQPEPPRAYPGLIAAVGAAVLVLAIVGGTSGYLLAGRRSTADGAGPKVAAAPSVGTVESATPSTGESPRSTGEASTAPTADGFPLPDVTTVDFERARLDLRELRLGVQVVFGRSGDDRRVERTEPAAGQLVRRGITVRLYVRGRAPIATVPGVAGLPCNDAGAIVADHGLVPAYPAGRTGRVLRQDPAPPTDTVRWNEQVTLYCGTASPSPASS